MKRPARESPGLFLIFPPDPVPAVPPVDEVMQGQTQIYTCKIESHVHYKMFIELSCHLEDIMVGANIDLDLLICCLPPVPTKMIRIRMIHGALRPPGVGPHSSQPAV